MTQNTLLIDANSIGYASQQATKLNCGSMETQAAFGFIKTMRELRMQFPHYTPMVLWDGRAEWRFKLHPEYKSNRKDTPEKVQMKESYAKQKPFIELLLRHLGVRQLTAFKQEADDLGGYFVRKLSAVPGSKIGLITGDGDWKQLVRGPSPTSGAVWWKDPRDDSRFIDHKNFYAKTGCLSPFAYLETKILTGDSSDCISGVGGIGETGAPEFIAEFGSVREFWRRCESGEFVPRLKAHKRLLGTCEFDQEQWVGQYPANDGSVDEKTYAKALKKHTDGWPGQGRSIYKRNFQLMQLLKVPPPAKTDIKLDVGKFDKEAFANVCEELAFVSILRNLDEFTAHFNK